MVLRDNRAPPRSGTFDEGHPIPARRTWGGSRGPQRPMKLHLRPGAKKPLVSSHPSSLAQVYHFVFITPPCLPDPRDQHTHQGTPHTYPLKQTECSRTFCDASCEPGLTQISHSRLSRCHLGGFVGHIRFTLGHFRSLWGK